MEHECEENSVGSACSSAAHCFQIRRTEDLLAVAVASCGEIQDEFGISVLTVRLLSYL